MPSPEYQRAWREKNREHSRAYMREYMKNRRLNKPEQVKREDRERGIKLWQKTKSCPEALTAARKTNRDRARRNSESALWAAVGLLATTTGLSRSEIPSDLAEAKAAHLAAKRALRDVSGRPGPGRKRLRDEVPSEPKPKCRDAVKWRAAQIRLPPKLKSVFLGEADVRGAHGGRGSAKTRNFAKMTAVRAFTWSKAGREGIILCGRQFMNSLADSSLEEIKAAIRSEPWLEAHFDIGETYVRTKDGRISYSFVGLERNVDSIKSKSRILLAWIDEAEGVTEKSWVKLIPTLREEDSEIWVTWNPEDEESPTNKRFHTKVAAPDLRTKIVEMNWRDNPWFPAILDRKRLKDKEERPDNYDHIWEGAFVTAVEGAYFASCLTKARAENRIGRVEEDQSLVIRLFADLGGTGAKADNFVFWAGQHVGDEICWVNHYEQQGQPIATHLNWLREQGYTPGRAKIWLPHDGETHDRVIDVSFESAFRALGWYHEKRDDKRAIGLGPEHDWSSHAADAFGLMCVAHKVPQMQRISIGGI
jgi:phage terminase large subunit